MEEYFNEGPKGWTDIDYTKFSDMLKNVEEHKFFQHIDFLISRLTPNLNHRLVDIIIPILTRVAKKYPYESAWWLWPMFYFDEGIRGIPIHEKKQQYAIRIERDLQADKDYNLKKPENFGKILANHKIFINK